MVAHCAGLSTDAVVDAPELRMTAIPSAPENEVMTYAMTVLVPDVEVAQRLAAALDDVRRHEAPLVVIAVPPVRGLAFFADADRQPKLDRWWSHAIPDRSVPVHLLVHEEGVPAWLPGLDGHFVVGVAGPDDGALYGGLENVTVADGMEPLDIALATVQRFASALMFREDAGLRLEKRLPRALPETGSRFRRARLRPADEFPRTPAAPATDHHPIPNLPPFDPVSPLSQDARREDLVKALADTLERLQRIRTIT